MRGGGRAKVTDLNIIFVSSSFCRRCSAVVGTEFLEVASSRRQKYPYPIFFLLVLPTKYTDAVMRTHVVWVRKRGGERI